MRTQYFSVPALLALAFFGFSQQSKIPFFPSKKEFNSTLNVQTPHAANDFSSLLDGDARMMCIPVYGQVLGWQNRLKTETNALEKAQLHLWVGEYAQAQDRSVSKAQKHFEDAAELTKTGDALHGLAMYNLAVLKASRGSYQESVQRFTQVLEDENTDLIGKSNAALWLRRVSRRAEFRDRNAKLGIPETDTLNAQCGVHSLHTVLKALNPKISYEAVLKKANPTEFGSNIDELRIAAEKLGYRARLLEVTEAGLKALPKPLIAYVEHDHFVAITEVSEKGVTYACNDCCGGSEAVSLTWKQWRAMEANVFLVAVKKGSTSDHAIEKALANKATFGSKPQRLLLASSQPTILSGVARLASQLTGQISQMATGYFGKTYACGIGFTPNRKKDWDPTPTDGDPVNLANGEEMHRPAPDLVVYNPNGPSVVWQRMYTSFLVTGSSNNATGIDFVTQNWNQKYSFNVYDPTIPRVLPVVQGVNTGLTIHGATSALSGSLTWAVTHGGSTIADSSATNGWTVSNLSGSGVAVQSPSSEKGDDYRVIWKFSSQYFYYDFDVIATDEVRQCDQTKLTTNGTNAPSGQWQVFYSGSAIASDTTPNGWFLSNNTNTSVIVGAPLSAVVGTGYEIRYRSGGVPYSATFKVIAAHLKPVSGTKYVILSDGAKVQFNAPSVPSSSNTEVLCTPEAGTPFGIKWLYDSGNPYGKYQLIQKDGSIYSMEPLSTPGFTSLYTQWANYNLIRITDRKGNSIKFNYLPGASAAIPSLSTIVDETSNTTLLSVTRSNDQYYKKVLTISDCYNRSVYYTYDSNQRISKVSQIVTTGATSKPDRCSYGYAYYPLLTSVTSPSPTGTGTSSITFAYNGANEVTSQTDALGNQRVYTAVSAGTTRVDVKNSSGTTINSYSVSFDSAGRPTSYTDGTNSTVVQTLQYNDTDCPQKPSAVTDGNSRTTSFNWDAYGNLLSVTTPRGVTTTYTYSYTNFPLGRLSSVQEGSKPSTSFTYYEPSGLVNTVSGPAPGSGSSVTSTFTYDSLGNLLTSVTPGNGATTYHTTTYNYTSDGGYSQSAALGQPLTVTDDLSHVRHFRYDSQGRTTSAWDALGNTSDVTYTIDGRPYEVQAPATGQTGSGRAKVRYNYQYPGGPTTSVVNYDESGTAVQTVSYSYSATGQLLGTSGANEVATYTYDADNRLKTIVDGLSQTTTYSYNTAGYLSSVALPGGDTTSYSSYDNAGNLLTKVDPNGNTTTYAYTDSDGFLTSVSYTGASSQNATYAYDSYGRLDTVTDGTGSRVFSYGALNEILSVATTYTGLSAQTVSYGYYSDGSRSSMTTPAGTFTYNYDAAGRPSSLVNPYSETSSWSYLNNDWLSTQTLGNSAFTNYSFTNAGQLLSVDNRNSSNSILSLFNGVTYDGKSNILGFTASVPSYTAYSGATTHTYDAKNQLTAESSSRASSYSNSFAYDSAGNPTTFKGVSQSFNSRNQFSGTGWAYDANGNPTTYGGSTVTYDRENHPTAFASVLTCGYRADGLRAWKDNGTTRTYFLYDGTTPVCELDGSANVTATNTFGANGLLSRRVASTSTYYTFDLSGGTAERLNASQAVVTDHMHDSFGVVLSSSSTTDPYIGLGAQSGYYTDSETGLQLCTWRYYDPARGRFINRDPIGQSGGINTYAYCTNNPVMGSDPLGLCPGGGPGNPACPPGIGGNDGGDTGGGGDDMPGNGSNSMLGQLGSFDVWSSGTATGFAGLADAFSFGHCKSDYYAGKAGYDVSVGSGVVAREALIQAGTLGAGNAIAAARAAKIASDGEKLVTVARWGREGLEAGDWVMKGRATKWNYILSGKMQPANWIGKNIPAAFETGQEFLVPTKSLKSPMVAAKGIDKIFAPVKHLIGQRVYLP